jgi:hypothetical protein
MPGDPVRLLYCVCLVKDILLLLSRTIEMVKTLWVNVSGLSMLYTNAPVSIMTYMSSSATTRALKVCKQDLIVKARVYSIQMITYKLRGPSQLPQTPLPC